MTGTLTMTTAPAASTATKPATNNNNSTTTTPTIIYHEKQSCFDQFCLIHAINMMMGVPHTVTKETLDGICNLLSPDSSSWWNPHKSALGLGNYDVNVAMVVFDRLGYDLSFFNPRHQSIAQLMDETNNNNDDSILGLLLNVKGSIWLPGSRHWMVLKKPHTTTQQMQTTTTAWYLLDSKENGPILIQDIHSRLKYHLEEAHDYILIVRKKKE